MTKNTEQPISIAFKIEKINQEISYLEDLITTTASPLEETLAELKMLKDVRQFYLSQEQSHEN